jgi:transcription antitermination protein NusB
MSTPDKPADKKSSTKKADPISARTAARVAAVQALYQMDLAGTDLNDVIAEFLGVRFADDAREETIEGADRTFFADILRAVLRRQREIDPMVDEQLATGWRLVRVDAILRAALRAGVAELLDRDDVPARVVINEYINVARFFFSEDEPRVVNGVLDKIARAVRPQEFEGKSTKT